jgi:hypothetical protein
VTTKSIWLSIFYSNHGKETRSESIKTTSEYKKLNALNVFEIITNKNNCSSNCSADYVMNKDRNKSVGERKKKEGTKKKERKNKHREREKSYSSTTCSIKL